MANFEIPQNPEFDPEVRKFETTDPAHANLFNTVVQKILNCITYLKSASDDHREHTDNPHNTTKAQVGLGNADNTSDKNKPVSILMQAALDLIYASANGYTDAQIATLINGAPETMNTLKELADAIAGNEDIMDALNEAIGKKAAQVELDGHTGNSTIHLTASERTKWNAKQDALTIDSALSTTSTNPPQNKAVTEAINAKANTSALGTQCTFAWNSSTKTLTITPK